jgi:hypothetical protein
MGLIFGFRVSPPRGKIVNNRDCGLLKKVLYLHKPKKVGSGIFKSEIFPAVLIRCDVSEIGLSFFKFNLPLEFWQVISLKMQ